MKRYFFVFSLLLFIFAWSGSGDAVELNEWTLHRDTNNIKIYSRKVSHSNIEEVKGKTVIRDSLEHVISKFEDESKYEDWCYKCKTAKLVKKEGEDREIYFRMDLPWPMKDRDSYSIHKKEVDLETGAVSYNISDISSRYSDDQGCVRITNLYGTWRFTPLKDGKVELYYQQFADVGGHIPQWFINWFKVENPYQTLKNLREFIREE